MSRCTATKKDGERCKSLALTDLTVCAVHGGRAQHIRATQVIPVAERVNALLDSAEGVLVRFRDDPSVAGGKMVLEAVRSLLPGLKLLAELNGELKPAGVEITIEAKTPALDAEILALLSRQTSQNPGAEPCRRCGYRAVEDAELVVDTPALPPA